MQLQIRYRYHYERCLCHVSEQAGASVALEGAVGCTVYVCFIISLTAARVCINRRIFSCCRGNEHYKNSWAKSGGLKDRRAPWSKKWGVARAQRPNSLRLRRVTTLQTMWNPWQFHDISLTVHGTPAHVKCYSYHAGTSFTVRGEGRNATVHDPNPKWKRTSSAKSRMDANMQLTINSFRPLFPDKIFPDISRFSR